MVLAGGVGGAKLVWGLAQLLPPTEMAVIVNTGDDFRHLGLTICPDLDTIMYTLAGLANPDTGWGVVDDSFAAMEMLDRYGQPNWFRLGDRDLATQVTRTALLGAGQSLTQVTTHLCRGLGVAYPLLPMTDAPAPTMIVTDEEVLPFQDWFVRRRWQPAVRRVLLPDPPPRASTAVVQALEAASLVVIAPSNPLVSVAPILNVRPVRDLLHRAPVVAVSPIIGGAAVKGPAAKMMAELGLEVSPVGVARLYGAKLLDCLVFDEVDADLAPLIEATGIRAVPAATWMQSAEDRVQLARTVLEAWTG